MRSTQPPAREAESVDNSPRYWVGRSGIVHRTVRWAACGARVAPWPTLATIPDGRRCLMCFPRSEVPRKTTALGWPRHFHPLPVVPK